MPDNFFDKIIKKVGDTEKIYYAKDSTARNLINSINESLAGISDTLDGLWNVGESPVLYVSKTNSRFTTINSAIDYARTYCSTTNRVTIVITSGMYQEYIDLDDNPGIDFYGLNNVLIRSSVAWRLSTLRCSNTVTCYNIEFENYYTPGEGEHAGYALHADPVTGSQTYVNCSFYADHNSACGVGMGNNGRITFIGCTMRGATGGLYIHNRAVAGTVGQWARFIRTRFESHDGTNCIRIDDSASMQELGSSTMGMVFIQCTGNNNGITYKYGNPAQILPYIPTSSATYNIFLSNESQDNGMIALDPVKQTVNVSIAFSSNGDSGYRIPFTDAYKYEWTVTSFRYKDWNGSAWGSFTTFSGSHTIQIVAGQPDAIRVSVPGTQLMGPATRSFELQMTGVPRKTLSLPYTIEST